MKKQYLTTIEYRYNDAPKYTDEYTVQHLTKIVTLGVFDTIEEANNSGNKVLETLEAKYKLNPNYNKEERLGDKYNKSLVSNLGYIETPFSFYLKITTLNYDTFDQSITDVTEAVKRYREFKTAEKTI